MNHENKYQSDLDIDPAMILLGLGYATSLCLAIGWFAAHVI